MQTPIPLSQPFLTDLEESYVKDSVHSGWLTQSGSFVTRMESTLKSVVSKFDNSKDVTTTSNGTTALHLTLMSLGIRQGDEVIVPNFGYIAPVNAILMCNAIPVVVDVNESDWCINPELVAKAVTANTKAVIVIDNYGAIPKLDRLRALIPEHVLLIEDAAESFPSNNFNSHKTFEGDFIVTSFYANKVVTSAEGGAIFGPYENISKINSLKNQSVRAKGIFEHIDIGYNYRISNLHAALFMAQWERLSDILQERNRVFKKYFEIFEAAEIKFESNQFPEIFNPWMMTIRLPGYADKMGEIRSNLANSGIETRPGFKELSKHEYLRNRIRIASELTVSEKLSGEIISLPTYPELDDERISFVSDALLHNLKISHKA